VTVYLRIGFSFAIAVVMAVHARAADVSGPSLLFDPFSGEVISQDRAGEPWYPASLTKLMTSYVIFKKIREGKLRIDQEIPISELAHSQPASHTGLPVGKSVTIDFALQAMLVYSANDMAYVLAEAASGSVEKFADDMNDVAKSMDLQATHFVNPNGLFDPRHISSARDLGVIAALIVNQYPEHLHYFSQEAVMVGKRRLPNHNSLIRIMPEAVGMKTGFVCNSGYNLVGSAIRGGRQLVSVVLGARSGGVRAKASRDMLDTGFEELGKPNHGKLGEIVDQSYGSIVPADMTTTVCKKKEPVTPVNAHHMAGWGVSFGTFDTAMKADMALRGRLISPAGINAGGTAGIIKLESKAGYAAMLWNLAQDKTAALCGQYKTEGASCDVMPDVLLLQMAAAAPPEVSADAQASDEGSDDDSVKPVLPPKNLKAPKHSARGR
jgi:D-alanyl-D-alanine carboxypeptidase